ncbi:MAG TPA: BamA/TamA family outer membrane protein [Vicinamibacterales bacterium]|nr:BamA/TamA family outer membrane protein [Vicinamibacterales bacterium]
MAATAAAQSFGRNKVHYDDLDFRVLETAHFDIHYYSAEHDAVVDAARLAERWYERLSVTLDDRFDTRQPIVLYASHAQFAQTNIVPGFLSDGVGGVTDQERGRVVLPFAAGLGETDHVLGHELVHAFQRDILRKHGRLMSSLPLWFVEGMAEYVSIGGLDANTTMWLRDAVASDRLPRIDQLEDPQWFPYRFGQALWAFLADRYGAAIVKNSLSSKSRGSAAQRLAALTGQSTAALSEEWHAWIRERVPVEGESDETAASKAIVTRADGGQLNVGPALSPDGTSIVFLSEKDQYSIDVFLADASTGVISRKLVETAEDPHFESLQFIESAGGWDPAGRRVALAALAGGAPVLSIFDARSGKIEREFPIHGTDQVFGPTWSPDGRRLAFSAMAGGYSDLYFLDLESGRVQALTRDRFADVQPAWSPDGRTIAFATDRFTSSADTLSFGRFRLATIDVDTAVVHELPAVPGAKNIDPHWSHDGSSLFFVADPADVSNVYRLELATGDLFKVTSESIGVSGVTALSPSLSVAGADDRLAYSVYKKGAFEIHTRAVDHRAPRMAFAPLRLAPPAPVRLAPLASVRLAPLAQGEALAAASSFTDRPYRAALSLDRYVQPYLSAGGGSTGGFIRGGVGLSFGDMLGDRQLDLAVQAGAHVEDFILQAGYTNLRSRWNWGISGAQVPWLTGSAPGPLETSADGSTLSRTADVYRQLHREISGVAMYPFSAVKRLELSTGVQSIAFDRESTLSLYSPATGRLLNQTTGMSPAAPTATLFETGAALVYDTSVFGAASPVLGQRYRLSVAPTFGSVQFTTLTADYRRYFMPVRPFTIAMRVMDIGRAGGGSDDPRLLPLAWSLRDLVRGYGDTGPDASALPYLTATNMLVGNLEMRFPVPAAFVHRRWSALPIEGLIFADAGRFSMRDVAAGSAPRTLSSAGTGVRIVAAGVVFELDAARTFDPLSHGWTFSFNFRPGF